MVEKDSFSKINLLIRKYYIGIYTVCLPLGLLRRKIFSFKSNNFTSTKFTRYVFLSSFFFRRIKNFLCGIKFCKVTNFSSITIFIFNCINHTFNWLFFGKFSWYGQCSCGTYGSCRCFLISSFY